MEGLTRCIVSRFK